MPFGIDLPGRVNNIRLTKSDCLHPLFEAVVNSIQEIGEVNRKSKAKITGRITVRIDRSNLQKIIEENGLPVNSRPIQGFTVEDDGIGFTEENFRSFQRSDTTRKVKKGGKGVGRFLWLKAFNMVHIESVFSEKGAWFRRSFDFACTDDGIENHKLEPTGIKTRNTVIKLDGLKTPYRDVCPKTSRAISKQIIEHCMPFFVIGACPQIVVHDPDDGSEIDLGEMFDSDIKISETSKAFGINGRLFRITHLLTRSSEEAEHRLHFCAHQRSVKSEALKPRIPNLHKGLLASEQMGPIYYTGLVIGDYLDERVSTERTRFDITDDIFSTSPDVVQWKELTQNCVGLVKEFLSPYLAPIQKKKMEQIEALVRERSPQYRTLLKHRPAVLEDIPPDLDDDQLDLKLYEQYIYYESQLRTQATSLLEENEQGYEEVRKHFGMFIEEWNEQGISKLAQYVVHRKATLEIFTRRLKLRGQKHYALEDAIHKLIFPMRKTSDEIPYDSMNLWLIDERLAYHSYLASDKRLDQLENCSIEGEDRPDLLIFNSPFAFSDDDDNEEYNSIVIIEFKRPMRNDYKPTPDEEGNEDAKKNPISQVQRYIDKIRNGKAIDREGRHINVCANVRFYVYIVCDITPSLRQIAVEATCLKRRTSEVSLSISLTIMPMSK
ncbi:ATP-binding protein [Singulisphaera sp. Ch08]|uniref:ATP-binding protein n=1 Tax=Singulisphaera sp. Ch08 TaxID=3120278 RepID=A0AAU7C8P6_9BACT